MEMRKVLYIHTLLFSFLTWGYGITFAKNFNDVAAVDINNDSMNYKKQYLLLKLKRSGIEDINVINAIEQVPREEFIPQKYRNHAYDDVPFPIGCDQTISSPYIVAYMVQAANLTKESQVLEIGTGSGYQTAILGLLCNKVISIEIVPELAKTAQQRLKKLGFYANHNIEIQTGSGYSTQHKNNSFDAIIVTAAPLIVPEHLKDLLKVNGRLIIPVGNSFDQQKLLRITKCDNDKFIEENLLAVRFVPMVE